MKQINTKILSASLLVAMMVVSSSIPAFAMENETTINDTPSQTNAAQARAAKSKAEHDNVKLAKAEAKSDDKPGRTAEQKQKVCDARKKSINHRVNGLVVSSQKAQRNIDRIFAKAQKYHDDKNVQLDNYDSLLAAAKSAQTTSAASVTALAAAVPTIDCSNGHAGDDAAAFRTQAKKTRADIKAYRESVKTLLKALHTTKSEAGQQWASYKIKKAAA